MCAVRQKPPTAGQLRRRIGRALLEIDGNVSEPMPPAKRWRVLGEAMDLYIGPAMSMSAGARWEEITYVELELICDATEERAAMIGVDRGDFDKKSGEETQ